jgi:hypothetical protein
LHNIGTKPFRFSILEVEREKPKPYFNARENSNNFDEKQ